MGDTRATVAITDDELRDFLDFFVYCPPLLRVQVRLCCVYFEYILHFYAGCAAVVMLWWGKYHLSAGKGAFAGRRGGRGVYWG